MIHAFFVAHLEKSLDQVLLEIIVVALFMTQIVPSPTKQVKIIESKICEIDFANQRRSHVTEESLLLII